MSQLAVRLANEGVPVQAIARATGMTSSDVRAQLANALVTGDLTHLPNNDWATDKRDRPIVIAFDNKSILEAAARRVFVLSPVQARLLLALLRGPETSLEQLQQTLELSAAVVYVMVCRLRRAIEKYDFTIHTMYGFGYCMSAAHQRKILGMLRS